MNSDLNNENFLTEKKKNEKINRNGLNELKKTLIKINSNKPFSRSTLLLNKENLTKSFISNKFKNLLLENFESESKRKNLLKPKRNSSFSYIRSHNIKNVLKYKNYLEFFKFENLKKRKIDSINKKILNSPSEVNLKKFYLKKKNNILKNIQTYKSNQKFDNNLNLIKENKFLTKRDSNEKKLIRENFLFNRSDKKSSNRKKINIKEKNILKIPYMIKIKPYKNFCDALLFFEQIIKKKKIKKKIQILN